MSAVTLIREKYQLNQQQLADCLGISRSLLAMVETGKRSLPFPALKKLNTLIMAYEPIKAGQVAAVKDPVTTKQKLAIRRHIKLRIQQLNRKMIRLENKLDLLENTYGNAYMLSTGINKLQVIAAKKEPVATDQLLDARLKEANNKLLASHPSQQFILQAKLLSLKFELALLNQQLQTTSVKAFNTSEEELLIILKNITTGQAIV